MDIFANQRSLFAIILFFGLLAMTARSATDPDLWWHLRTGQWIVETGHVPHTDPFSFTRAGSRWVCHEWMSEVLFYVIWKIGGPVALIVFSSLITTIGFLFLYSRCHGEPHWAAAATVLGAYASAPCWGTRPQMFTFVFASLFLWLLERAERRHRLLLWIPPLFLLWLNLHGGFALGPVLLFLYAGGLALEAATGTTAWREARPILRRVSLATLACLALVPLNPSGARLYLYPIETVRAFELRSLIVEWLSPDFHQSMYLPCLLVILLVLAALAWSGVAVRGRVLLPLTFMLLSALDAVRHIPIFILLAVPVLAQAGSRSSQRVLGLPAPTPRQRSRLVLSWTTIALLAAFVLWRWTNLARRQEGREADGFPRNAVTALRTNNLRPSLFAYYDWGGYAIWELYPQYRVFADGRSDLYGDELMKEAAETLPDLRQGWRADLDRWNVETILIPPDTALAQALHLDAGWRAFYSDPQAVIFVRRHAEAGVTSGTIAKTGIK